MSRRTLVLSFIACVLLLSTLPPGRLTAQLPNQSPDQQPALAPRATPAQPLPPIPHAPQATELRVPVLDKPLTLADFENMAPRASIRERLAHVDNFTQIKPADGLPATERTEVWFARTSTTFYAVFVAYDSRPNQRRAHLARRENIGQDDNVSILFDPFADHRRGILFKVNPNGVQADALHTESGEDDYSYDQVWDSDGRTTPQGWIALLAIPFRSIRSPEHSTGWGIIFSRYLPRNSEVDFWPRVSQQISGLLPQEATLLGLEGSHSPIVFQANPYVLAHNIHILETQDPLHPFFSTRKLQGTAGGDIKAVIKDTIVVDATINPDFSQVESDEPQFTVNQRFSVFFPELRPFFLENANYFSTPINLVYTRRVANPEYGARVTGKINHTSIGLFAADDRQPGRAVAPSNPLHNHRAYFAVARIAQDIGAQSSVGVIYTDREFAGGFSRAGGADFLAHLSDHWSAQGQFVLSSTLTPAVPASPGIAATASSYAAGPAIRADFNRSGRSFNLNNVSRDYASGFTTQVGFIRITDIRQNETQSSYTWHPTNAIIQSATLAATSNFGFNHNGDRLFRYLQLQTHLNLPRSTVISPQFGENSDTLGPADSAALTHRVNLTQNFAAVFFRTAPIPQINAHLFISRGGNPNYNPPVGIAPSVLNEWFAQGTLTLQPVRALTIDNIYLLDANRTRTQHAFVFENQTLRTKINYQFTRAFSVRAIVEYDSLLANPLYTSLTRTKQVSTEVLFTWLPHPGTAIYAGYDSNLQNLDRALCNRGNDGLCDTNNTSAPRALQYLNDGRQIFIKASYLFRF